MDLLTVDWDSEPVGGVELTVVFMEHRWYSVREQAEDGSFYWDWTTEDIPVYTTTVTTGDDGQAAGGLYAQEGGQLPGAGHRPRRARRTRSAAAPTSGCGAAASS